MADALVVFENVVKRFDDFEAATLLSPGVSVVSQDFVQIGTTAARILVSRMRGDDEPHRTIVVPTTLVLRGSEKPASL